MLTVKLELADASLGLTSTVERKGLLYMLWA